MVGPASSMFPENGLDKIAELAGSVSVAHATLLLNAGEVRALPTFRLLSRRDGIRMPRLILLKKMVRVKSASKFFMSCVILITSHKRGSVVDRLDKK